MPTLSEIRQQYPQYADMPDAALADALHRKFYADMPREQFNAKIGFDTNTAGVGGAAGALKQGVTFGFADEAAGVGRAAGRFLRSVTRDGKSVGEAWDDAGQAYNRGVGAERNSVAEFREANPGTAIALEAAGGFVGGAPRIVSQTAARMTSPQLLGSAFKPGPVLPDLAAATSAATAPLTTAQAAIQGAKAGATGGAVAGFGSGEGGLENRLQGAAIGGTVGGVAGGSVPLVANVVGRYGGRLLDGMGLRNPEAAGDRQILRAFERDAAGGGPSLEAVAANMARNTRGNALPEMIPDLAGENVKNLARDVTQMPGTARQIAQTALQNRAEGQGTRLYGQVNKSLAPDEYYQAEGRFLETLRKNANAAFDDARASVPYVWSKELDALLDRPTMKEALGSAMRKAADEGEPFGVGRKGGQFMRLEDFNKGDKIESLTLDAALRVKRVLDQKIETQGKNEFTGKLNDDGRIWTALKNQFMKAVSSSDKSGKISDALKQYAGDAEVVSALRDGREFLKLDPEQIAASVKDMSFAERDAFRSGVARAIKDKIDSVRDGADATRQIFGNSAIRDKIKAAFDDDKAFAKFESMMKRERTMAETRNLAGPRTGSPTVRTGAGQDDMQIDPMGGVVGALASGGGLRGALAAGTGSIMRRAQGMNSASADYLGPILFETNQRTNMDQLARLLQQRTQGRITQSQNQALARALLGGTGIASGVQTDQRQ
jgi:hypothetical protein